MQSATPGKNRTGAAVAEEGVRAMPEANERWAPMESIDITLSDADRGAYILQNKPPLDAINASQMEGPSAAHRLHPPAVR